MKFSSVLFLVLLLIVAQSKAQQGLCFSYQNGGIWNQFNYINAKGASIQQFTLDGTFGLCLSYQWKTFSVESGVDFKYTSAPLVAYNYENSSVSYSSASYGSSGMNNIGIPLRIRKEFNVLKNVLFLAPEFGFSTVIARNYSEGEPVAQWGENITNQGILPYIPTSPDSTLGIGYRTTKFNFGSETSLSMYARIKKRFDVYIKGTFYSSFSPLYYENITHYSSDETVSALQTMSGNSLQAQIGLRIHLDEF